MKRTLFFILLIVIFSLFALKSLFIPNFYTSHDGLTHTARIAQYYRTLLDGQIPPRWAGGLYGGLGSPIFVYIYPLPYLLGSIFHFFGASFTFSFELVMALGFILGGIFMFFFLKELFGELPAFVGALFYLWAPYKFSLIYVRAAFAENLAYAFLPLAFLSILKIFQKKQKWVWILSLSIALTFLSHNLATFMALPIILLFIIFQYWRKRDFVFFRNSLFGILWGFLISAFILLPDLFERQFTHFSGLFKNFWQEHLVTLGQLFHSPWGYGFSFKGRNDGMSFQIGLIHILVFFLAFLLILISFIKNRVPKFLPKEEIKKEFIFLAFLFIAFFLMTIFLMIDWPIAHFLYKSVPLLGIVDLPWRFLGLVVFATSFLSAFFIRFVPSQKVVIIFLIFLLIYANRNHLRINQSVIYEDQFFKNYQDTATYLNEFTPSWRQTEHNFEGFDQKVEFFEGKGEFQIKEQRSNRLSFAAEAYEDSKLMVNIFYFPGWEVKINGREARLNRDFSLGVFDVPKGRDLTGLFSVNLKKGQKSEFVFQYKETPLRMVGDLISLFSFLVALAFLIPKKVIFKA